MATLTVLTIAQAGVEPAAVAAAASGDAFANDGRTFFHAINGSGAACEVTFDSILACDQAGDHDLIVDVPAGEARFIGPFQTARWNDGSGLVQVTYESETSLTVAAYKLSA